MGINRYPIYIYIHIKLYDPYFLLGLGKLGEFCLARSQPPPGGAPFLGTAGIFPQKCLKLIHQNLPFTKVFQIILLMLISSIINPILW